MNPSTLGARYIYEIGDTQGDMLGWSDFPNATRRTPIATGCRLMAKVLEGINVGASIPSPCLLLTIGWKWRIVRSVEYSNGSWLM